MILSNDGLSLWYDTPDAPAPAASPESGASLSLTIGMQPVRPANAVQVRYRLDEGRVRTLPARALRTDYRTGSQYFLARFPPECQGRRVDYSAVGTCAGRQVPRHGTEDQMQGHFLAAPAPDPPPAPARRAPDPRISRFIPGLELMGLVTVNFKPPTLIGETPEGLRIDFFATDGTLRGDNVSGKVLGNSADFMVVLRDGIGLIDVHATVETDDGALVSAAYRGLIDFGLDGYLRVKTGNYPVLPRLQVAPRLLTEHPRYQWMNRTQFLGVGHVRMEDLVLEYDLFAVRTLVDPGWSGRP